MSQSPEIDDQPSDEDRRAAADLESPGSAGNRLALVLNSLMAATTLGAVASLAMAIGSSLR